MVDSFFVLHLGSKLQLDYVTGLSSYEIVVRTAKKLCIHCAIKSCTHTT